MFEIATNVKGIACIVTDNPKIADAIHEEDIQVPIWFTGAPSKETARALAEGMTKEFDREATIVSGGHCKLHARFRDSK